MTTNRVLVVGSINADTSLVVRRLPSPGETVLTQASEVGRLGGKGANQAVAAARMGSICSIVGAVGADEVGRSLVRQLAEAGVDVTGVAVIDRPSGVAYVVVDAGGENFIVVDRGANEGVTPAMVTDRFGDPAVVLVQFEIPIEAAIRALDSGREKGITTIGNVSPVVAADVLPLESIGILLVNQHEARALSGNDDAIDGGRWLAAQTKGHVIVTRGAAGAVLIDRGAVTSFPAPPVRSVLDTTGAGDVFAGVLAAAIARGLPVEAAVEPAIRAASWSVQRRGVAAPRPADL